MVTPLDLDTPDALASAALDAFAGGARVVWVEGALDRLAAGDAWAATLDAFVQRCGTPRPAFVQVLFPSDVGALLAALVQVRAGERALVHVDLTPDERARVVTDALAWLRAEGVAITSLHAPAAPVARPIRASLGHARVVTSEHPEAQRLLDVLACVFEPVPRDIALEAAECGPDTLALLLREGLVRARAERIAIVDHELHDELARRQTHDARRALYRRLLPLLRADVHMHGLAGALAVAVPGVDAAPLFVSAGERALEQRRFVEAARHYRDALATDTLSPAMTQRIQLARGRALAAAAEPGPAADALRAATHGPDRLVAREATQRAARELLVAGRIDDGLALLDAALREHGDTIERTQMGLLLGIGWRRLLTNAGNSGAVGAASSEARARVELLYTGVIGLGLVDGLRAFAFQTRHLRAASDAGDLDLVLRALAAERVFAATIASGAERRLATLDRNIADGFQKLAAIGGVTPELRGHDALARGQAALMRGDFASANKWLRDAEWILTVEARDVGAELQQLQIFRLWTHIWTGDLAAIAHERTRLAPDSALAGRRSIAAALAVEGGVLLALARDDVAAARAVVDQALASEAQRRTLTVSGFNAWAARIQVMLYAGDDAYAAVHTMWGRLRSEGYLGVQIVRIEAYLLRGRAALAAGDVSGARDIARRLAREHTSLADGCSAFLEAAITRRGGPAHEAITRALGLTRAAGLALYEQALAAELAARSMHTACGTPLVNPRRFAAMLWGDAQA